MDDITILPPDFEYEIYCSLGPSRQEKRILKRYLSEGYGFNIGDRDVALYEFVCLNKLIPKTDILLNFMLCAMTARSGGRFVLGERKAIYHPALREGVNERYCDMIDLKSILRICNPLTPMAKILLPWDNAGTRQ